MCLHLVLKRCKSINHLNKILQIKYETKHILFIPHFFLAEASTFGRTSHNLSAYKCAYCLLKVLSFSRNLSEQSEKLPDCLSHVLCVCEGFDKRSSGWLPPFFSNISFCLSTFAPVEIFCFLRRDSQSEILFRTKTVSCKHELFHWV